MERQTQPIPTQPEVMSLEQIDALNDSAWELRRQDSSRSLSTAEEALTLATLLEYEAGIAYALLAKAYAQFRLGKLQEARSNAEKARTYFKTLDDKQGLLRTYNTLGIIYGESGELLGSLRAFLETDVLCKELHDKQGEADALNNIGIVYSYLGDHVSTLDYQLQSLKVCKEQGFEESEKQVLLNLGVSYYELGQYEEALEYLFRTLERGAENEPHLHALVLCNIGRSYHKLGKNDKAREYLERSLHLNEEVNDTLNASYVLDSLAVLDMSLQAWDEAHDYLQKSVVIKNEAGDKRGQSEALVLLGQTCLQQDQLELAETHLQEALKITEEVGNKIEQYKAHQSLSEVYKTRGQFQKALESYQRYNTLREEVLNDSSGQHLQSLRVRFEVSQEARENELFRQKNLELAEKNERLNKLNESLQKANAEKAQLLKELERQAREDALTGLYNRRYFDDVFAKAFAQSQRLHTPLSIAISDIDNFKLVNDRFSHQMGDLVLRTVAKLMKETVRDIDTVARYGGEEFVVLLPAADVGGAKAVCERIRVAVENYPWHTLNPELKITLSLGIANDIDVANCDRMMAIADDKLYKAKRNGKNQVYL
jgi:diguanylate cyclase (GGDEF)-like protein